MNTRAKRMNNDSKIYIAGHAGMVGSAIHRYLSNNGYNNIITKTRSELDLRNQNGVNNFFKYEQPEYVFLAAARVGGILANSSKKAEFFYDNATISQNIIHAAYLANTKKLLNFGSSCIYPRNAKQPLKEEYLLTGPLEITNDAYAIAKIAAIKMCQYYNEQHGTDFISIMPTNLYGPYDNFDYETSHVLPAIIRKLHDAKINGKKPVLWGTGMVMREFLYSEDLAEAAVFLMNHDVDYDLINVGVGQDMTIFDLVNRVSKIVGYNGSIIWDTSKPNGTPRKLLDISRISSLGWSAKTSLDDGIRKTYDWFLNNGPKTNNSAQCY